MNKVAEKIIEEAEAQALRIQNACDEESLALKKKYDGELKAIKKEEEVKLEKFYGSYVKHQRAQIDLRDKKEILQRKHELILEVLDDAKNRILEEKDIYVSIMKSLLKKGIFTGKEEIIVHDNDRKLFISELEPYVKDVLKKTDVRLSKDRIENQRGFYLHDGDMEYNATMDIIFKEIFEELEIDLIKILFE